MTDIEDMILITITYSIINNLKKPIYAMTNLKKFVRIINKAEFLKNNLNFRLHFPDCLIKINSISEENVDIQI